MCEAVYSVTKTCSISGGGIRSSLPRERHLHPPLVAYPAATAAAPLVQGLRLSARIRTARGPHSCPSLRSQGPSRTWKPGILRPIRPPLDWPPHPRTAGRYSEARIEIRAYSHWQHEAGSFRPHVLQSNGVSSGIEVARRRSAGPEGLVRVIQCIRKRFKVCRKARASCAASGLWRRGRKAMITCHSPLYLLWYVCVDNN